MNLQVAVKLLFQNDKAQYLLIQRSESLPDGTGIKWDIPGGRINSSEHLSEALAREVLEEIGVTLSSPIKLLTAQDVILSNNNLHVVRLTYITNSEADVKLGQQHQNFQWVTLDKALALPIDPYLNETLKSL